VKIAPLKIALVSKTNGCVGGASYFAENLGAWLGDAGHEVVQYCLEPKRGLRPYQQAIECRGAASRAVRHFNWRARRLGLVEPLPWEYWFGLRQWLGRFDLVHFHDLHMAVAPRTLEAVARRKPVVLTVHDCSTFTGGCINPLGCRRFQEQCGQCPQKSGLGRFDFTRSNLKLVRRLASSTNITYVFPSKWIQGEASGSLAFGSPTAHIPNGFDHRTYAFCGRQEARRLLGLAPDRKVVVVSSATLENRLKGLRYALEALKENQDLNPLAILIGQPSADLEAKLGDVAFWLTGFVEDRKRLGLLYAAADLLLYPSLGDNLPITIQEAMAAATPVLAFSVGGVPELVRHGQTGWLVPAGDQDALNRALRAVLELEDMEAVGLRAQKFVAEQFAPELCVKRHLDLYRAVTNVENIQTRADDSVLADR
jgi:glycosyltransferase involved in cell wall biosynthesis